MLARISKSLLDNSRRNKTMIMAVSNTCCLEEEKSMDFTIDSE